MQRNVKIVMHDLVESGCQNFYIDVYKIGTRSIEMDPSGFGCTKYKFHNRLLIDDYDDKYDYKADVSTNIYMKDKQARLHIALGEDWDEI